MQNSPINHHPCLPDFDDLSPDLRYRLLRQWQRRDWILTGLATLSSIAMLIPVAVPTFNVMADAAIVSLLRGGTIGDQVESTPLTDFATPVQEGDYVAGYRVTSGYGLRDTATLPEGASADHRGVDLATPLGTKLYAPSPPGTKVKVHCWQDADGGGLVADIKTPDQTFQALHLQDCTTGLIDGGRVFAFTGNSGIGAAHLDWRQRDRVSGLHQPPQKHYLLWALTGTAPAAMLTDLDVLRVAITHKESAFMPGDVNADSGALGLGQVMPENLAPLDENGHEINQAGWDYEALGEDLTAEAFLASPNKQIQIITHQLGTMYQQQLNGGHNKDEAIRRTAAAWYSGNPNKVNDTEPQHWPSSDFGPEQSPEQSPGKNSGTEYPSIKDYADDVLRRVHHLQHHRSRGGAE